MKEQVDCTSFSKRSNCRLIIRNYTLNKCEIKISIEKRSRIIFLPTVQSLSLYSMFKNNERHRQISFYRNSFYIVIYIYIYILRGNKYEINGRNHHDTLKLHVKSLKQWQFVDNDLQRWLQKYASNRMARWGWHCQTRYCSRKHLCAVKQVRVVVLSWHNDTCRSMCRTPDNRQVLWKYYQRDNTDKRILNK